MSKRIVNDKGGREVRGAGKRKSYFFRLVLIAVLCFLTVRLAMLIREPVATEIIRHGNLENKVNTNGYVIRSEVVIPSPVDGVLSCVSGEGERVNKNFVVASVFEGSFDEKLQSRIARINESIAELQNESSKAKLVVGDVFQIDSIISKTVEDVIRAVHRNEAGKLPQYKGELRKVVTQRLREKGEAVEEANPLDELLAEKKELEASAGANRADLISPVAGVFTTKVDGLEDFFDLSGKSNITPEVIAAADKLSVKKNDAAVSGEGVVKVVDNYKWFYAAAVDVRWAYELAVGDFVRLRFPQLSGKLLDANVESVSEEQDGKVAIVVSCRQYEENIYSARRLNADIIRKTHNGFKVPKSAVRILDDGSSGVYITKDGMAHFRNIEILHNGDEYVICKEDNNMKNGLLLYDEVVSSGNEIYDGKLVR